MVLYLKMCVHYNYKSKKKGEFCWLKGLCKKLSWIDVSSKVREVENSVKVNFWYEHFTDFSLFFLLCRFMWIMGVSMVISFQSMRRRQMRSITIFAKIIRRTLILFALGLFVSNCKLMMPLNAHATLLASYLSFIFWFFFPTILL